MQLLRTRPFFWLWLTHLAGMLANELASISVVVLVFATTGSTLQATGVLVARNLPPLLFGPFAGSIVDRLPRQATLVVANLLRAGLVGLFLLAGGEAGSGIWLGYLLVFCITLVDLVHKPALLSLLPTIAPPDRLVQANSIIFSTTQVAFMLSYGVGGLLAASGGPQLLGTLMLGLFVVAALTAALIGRAAPVATSTAREPFWSTVIAGFTYLRDHQLARTLITVEFFESWPHGVWTSALMLGFTVDALKAGQLGALGIDVYEEEAKLFFEDLSSTVITDDVFASLTLEGSVAARKHLGGTAPERVRAEIALAKTRLAAH